jgi:hypothetical protein
MNKSILIVVIIISLAIAATYYPWQQTGEIEPVIESRSVTDSDEFLKIPGKPEKSAIKYPVPGASSKSKDKDRVGEAPEQDPAEIPIALDPVVTQPPKQLPQLDESDSEIAADINNLIEGQAMTGLFSFKSFIRHFVVTIDNMTNRKLPQRYIFTQRVADKFSVIKQELDTALLDSKNFKRYSPYVNLVDAIDSRKLVTVYVRFYPLFQEAYESLGYPDRYFNDRLIQVIDHLLAAPEVEAPINLVRPKVFYQFADPELESLSAGQKILLRIGYANALRVKSKLRELRSILTKLSVQ